MINVKEISIGYDEKNIIEKLSLDVKRGEIISIIGPNGSGKSTLLKSLGRFLKVKDGNIKIINKNIKSFSQKELSKILSMVSQQNSSTTDITVKELVYFGRTPHKKWYESAIKEDEEIVNWAMKNTGVDIFKDRKLFNLSGGERQRAWIAMALAQQPEILFLDEPTTYLDMCHQLELMELVQKINRELNITVVMVLHDLNQAARYSNRIIIMKNGEVVADGIPNEVIKRDIIHDVYNVRCCITNDATLNIPQIYPLEVCYKRKDRCENCEI